MGLVLKAELGSTCWPCCGTWLGDWRAEERQQERKLWTIGSKIAWVQYRPQDKTRSGAIALTCCDRFLSSGRKLSSVRKRPGKRVRHNLLTDRYQFLELHLGSIIAEESLTPNKIPARSYVSSCQIFRHFNWQCTSRVMVFLTFSYVVAILSWYLM